MKNFITDALKEHIKDMRYESGDPGEPLTIITLTNDQILVIGFESIGIYQSKDAWEMGEQYDSIEIKDQRKFMCWWSHDDYIVGVNSLEIRGINKLSEDEGYNKSNVDKIKKLKVAESIAIDDDAARENAHIITRIK